MTRDPIKRARAQHRYSISEKGRARVRRYQETEKGKAAAARYSHSQKRAENHIRFFASQKGRMCRFRDLVRSYSARTAARLAATQV